MPVPRHTTVIDAMVSKLHEATPGNAKQVQQLETIDLWMSKLFELRAKILAGNEI